MVMRRTDARRRRVLSEEFVPTDESIVSESNKPMRAYSFGAHRRNQPKTTDLIPKRVLSLCLFLGFIALSLLGINALAAYSTELSAIIGSDGANSFAISGPGTFANWLCSVSLFLCAGVCVQLYLLRQHKRDDYSGMYRVWLLMSALFLLASMDCVVNLRTPAARLFEYLTHRSLLQQPWLVTTIEFIVLGLITVRMLFEVKSSRASLASVATVAIGFGGCVLIHGTRLGQQVSIIDVDVAYGNCLLVGCVGSLVSLTIYARFVFLHAQGLIEVKQKAAKAASSNSQAAESETSRTLSDTKATRSTDSPAKGNGASAAKTKAGTSKKKSVTPASDATAEPTTRKARGKTAAKKTLTVTSADDVAEETSEAPTPTPKHPKPASTRKSKRKGKSAATQPSNASAVESDYDAEDAEILSMSKSERRRARKLAKRAAREKKAA